MKICEKSDLASSYYKEIQSKKSPGAEKLGLWCAFVRTLFFFCELFCELQDSVSFGTLVDFHSSQIQVIFVYEIFFFISCELVQNRMLARGIQRYQKW